MAAHAPSRLLLVVALAMPLSASRASAEEGSIPPPAPAAQRITAPKSENKALWLSLGAFVIPQAAGATLVAIGEKRGNQSGDWNRPGFTLLGLGALFGPAVGYFYAEDAPRGLIGIGIRGGATLAAWGILSSSQTDSEWGGAIAAAVLLPVVVETSGIVDVVAVRRHTRAANRRAARVQATITPMRSSGALAYGVRISFD